MPRANAMVPPEAIRIEDEVWQDAFARREPARINRRRPLRVVDVVETDWLRESSPEHDSATPLPEPATAAGAITATTPSQAASTVAAPAPVRRTVKIQGRGAERNLPWTEPARRRPPRRVYERAGFEPDRVAMWAVLLGLLLVLVAIASGHG